MAVTMTLTCDYSKACPEPAITTVELTFAEVVYRSDICDQHVEAMLQSVLKLGFRPIASLVDGKRRDVFVTSSGRPFTSAEARAWLVSQGLKEGTAKGRVSAEHLELYAAAH